MQYMVALGYEREERMLPQRVEFDLDFHFRAAIEDDEDFLCYDGLAKHLLGYLREKEFRLIETLAVRVLEQVRSHARTALPAWPDETIAIRLRAKKCHVPVEWIKDGATVTLTDGSPAPDTWP